MKYQMTHNVVTATTTAPIGSAEVPAELTHPEQVHEMVRELQEFATALRALADDVGTVRPSDLDNVVRYSRIVQRWTTIWGGRHLDKWYGHLKPTQPPGSTFDIMTLGGKSLMTSQYAPNANLNQTLTTWPSGSTFTVPFGGSK